MRPGPRRSRKGNKVPSRTPAQEAGPGSIKVHFPDDWPRDRDHAFRDVQLKSPMMSVVVIGQANWAYTEPPAFGRLCMTNSKGGHSRRKRDISRVDRRRDKKISSLPASAPVYVLPSDCSITPVSWIARGSRPTPVQRSSGNGMGPIGKPLKKAVEPHAEC